MSKKIRNTSLAVVAVTALALSMVLCSSKPSRAQWDMFDLKVLSDISATLRTFTEKFTEFVDIEKEQNEILKRIEKKLDADFDQNVGEE